jgi:PII-like signaling protein
MASAQTEPDRSAAVDEDAAVLTCYFRERRHADAGSLSGALIDRYGRSQVAASVLLRGIDGYGPGQRPGAGHAFPLADGPPLTAVAVDTRPRIDAMLNEPVFREPVFRAAGSLAGPRLVTLERARLLSGEIGPAWLSGSCPEATRLTVYCGHADRVYQVPAFEAACELLYRRGIAGATVLPGVDGTAGARRLRGQFLRHGGDSPLMVIAVGDGERIAMVLPDLGGLFRNPVMTIAAVRLCKRDGQLISRPAAPPGTDAAAEPAGMAPRVKLTVYTSEAARHDGHSAHRAIVSRLRSAGVTGATSLRGIWGFHGDRAPHGDHFPRHGHHIPVVTTAVDTPERIAAAFDAIDALTSGRGLVTAETVLTPQPAGATAT